jgi:hypothetical protein
LVRESAHVLDFLESLQSLTDDFPAFFRIRAPCLPHRPLVHSGKDRIGQLEHIRQPLLGRQFPGAEDFLSVNCVLHRLQGSGGIVGFAHQAHTLAGGNRHFNRNWGFGSCLGHLHILQTPPFRVRNKAETVYFYDDERKKAMAKLGKAAEISRFKGLGEISSDEFSFMIGPGMRLDHVELEEGKGVKELLAFYMGKNTPDRQDFIIENLREDVDKQVQVA